MKSQQPITPLTWSNELAAAARDHCLDIGPKGLTSNRGSDGTMPWDRVERYG